MLIGSELAMAIRALRRGRGFSLTVLLLLAFGVGAATAMFSIVNGVLLQPLALHDPGRVVLVGERIPQMPQAARFAWFDTPASFLAWRREATDFMGISLVHSSRLPVMAVSQPLVLHGVKVSPNFFDVLEIPAVLGRTFRPGDVTDASNPVILTDRIWRSAFNADPTVIGRDIAMPGSGAAATVVGVLPAWFHLQGRELGPMLAGSPAEFYRPIELDAADAQNLPVLSGFEYNVIGRIRPGVTRVEALAQLNVIQANLARTAPQKISLFADLIPIQDFAVAQARPALWLLLGGVGAVLLIICVNLGGLWISRLADRRREWGIRAALGAPAGQLARQVLYQCLLLGLIGGTLGILCAALGLRALLAAAPANLPRLGDVHLDWRVFIFGFVLSLLAGLLTGLVPALRLARLDPLTILNRASGTVSSDPESLRSRQILIALQAALSALLLAAAGLLGLSFYRLVSQPMGFTAAHAFETEVSLIGYSDSQRLAILSRLPASALTLPGVSRAGFTTAVPLRGEDAADNVAVPGKTYTVANQPRVSGGLVSPGYLAAAGIALLAGRDLRESDRGQPAIVISAAAERSLWPGSSDPHRALGREIVMNGLNWNIVGVAADLRASLTAPALPVVYAPYWIQNNWIPYSGSLVVRSSLPVAVLEPELRQAIARFAPAAPLSPLQPLDRIAAAAAAPRRFQFTLLLLFAGLALFLAAVGVYALIAHSLARRGRELAVRVSLGATPGRVASLVLRQAMAPVAAGLAAGLGIFLLGHRLMAGLLFHVDPANPWVLTAVAGLVAFAALAACSGPLLRAARADPLPALRSE